MSKRINKVFFLSLIVILLSTITACKKPTNSITPIKMHSVSFFINDELFLKAYVDEGEQAKEIEAKDLLGKNFLYWSYNDKAYNFKDKVMENLKLYAVYGDADKCDVNSILTITKTSYDSKVQNQIQPTPNKMYRYYLELENSSDVEAYNYELSVTPKINFSGTVTYRIVTSDISSSTNKFVSPSDLEKVTISVPAHSSVFVVVDCMVVEVEAEIIPDVYKIEYTYNFTPIPIRIID
ncbi:MAG: hypothetical protein PUH11_08335 [Bacilli bacterium]|nr:hypothetical protein [Bacilli bacterium]